MADEDGGLENPDQILYDLLVQAEWHLDAEPLSKAEQEFWKEKGPLHWKLWRLGQISFCYLLQTARNSIRLKTSFGCPPTSFTNILSSQLPWTFSLSRDGKLLAVLTDKTVEVRSSKDSFTSVIAKFEVGPDPFPQWRKVTWNQSGSMLAVASSFGAISVFDTSCSLLYKIKQHGPSMNLPAGFSNCICTLLFLDAPKSSEWECILVAVTYHGSLQRFLLSNSVYKEEFTFSFSRFHPSGVASVTYSTKHNLLVVAGFDGNEPSLDQKDFTGAQAGISCWRELADFPHYTIVDTEDIHMKKVAKNTFKNLMNRHWQKDKTMSHGISNCCLSPNQDTLATLHQDGRIAFWRMPSLKLERTWSLSEQPSFDQESGAFFFNEKPNNEDSILRRQFINLNWWSDQAIICARGSGAISVSSKSSLENLLGQSEEMFEPWPSTTDASDGQFLVLECERKLKMNGEMNALKKNDMGADQMDHEDEEDETLVNRISKIFKQTLFFLTESDSLRPPQKKLKFLQRVYRLIALQSTTPEELYSRKISHEEYGEALELARRFKLDTDLVYQRQWTNQSPITVISIKDYLSKITNRFWVLNECMQRVPEDIDAMKHLLKYGLLGTDVQILQKLESEDKLSFVLKKDSVRDEDNDDSDSQNDEKTPEKSSTDIIDVESLTAKQIRLCRYRWQLLQYLDRLETYEVILGGPFRAAERYKSEFFLQFRCCNIIDQAMEYARTSCSEPLEELFTFHGDELLPHWFAILSNFPETTPVSSYKRLIPVLQEESGKLVIEDWKQLKHRDPDWVEATAVKDRVFDDSEFEEDQAGFIYQDRPDLAEFRSCKDAELLTKWFKLRAHEIESRSSLVDNALSLIEIGISNGVEGLNIIKDDLKWLEVLVYEEHEIPYVTADQSICLADFENLSNLAKLRLLMSKSTEESFLRDYVRWGKRFIDFIGKTKPEEQWKLQKKYFVDVAKSDLTFPLKIFEKSIPGSDEPLIPDVAKLMRLAIDCIYICKRDDQLDLAFKIVECLPTREESHLSSQIDDLHNKVDQLEQLLRGAEILELYSIPKTVSFLVDTKGNSKTASEILTTLCRNASRRQPSLTPNEWNLFLKHLQQLRDEVYDCIPIDEVYQIFVGFLLNSGVEEDLHLAKELMTPLKRKPKETPSKPSDSKVKKAMPRLTNATHRIAYNESVNLVLEAAKEYFNAGAHFTDPSMDLARKCLGTIEDCPPLVQNELDLLAALNILGDFDLTILPVQVRLYEEKLDLLKLAIDSVSTGYKKTAKIHKLARLLQISGSDEKERIGKVTALLGETALENEDYCFARDMCLSLIETNYAPGWTVCRKLCDMDGFSDLDAKRRLVSFALTFCNPDELEKLLVTKNLIETQLIYTELSKLEMNTSDADEELSDTEAMASDETDGQGPSSLLGRTQKQLTSKTKAIISNVSDSKWWRSQVKWVSDSKASKSMTTERSKSQEDCQRIHCHPFYDYSKIDGITELDDLFATYTNETELTINQLLLRSQKLCESRAEGAVSEPSTEVLLHLADSVLSHETMMFLGYILALAKVSDAEELFTKYIGNHFVLRIISYALSIEIESRKKQSEVNNVAFLYLQDTWEVVTNALKAMDAEGSEELGDFLRKYLRLLSDFVQAKTLEDLGKGVDVKRFMQDDEYKRETVLGMAMNNEEELLSTAISLAEKYDLPAWEVLCAHVEFLLTDSGLKVKEIQDRITKLNVVHVLRDNGSDVLEKMKLYVYPYINGKDHALLLIMFNLVQQCCGDDATIEGAMDVASHIRTLKKIKAAAPGLDYKDLITGCNPLETIYNVLLESNVHVLAKIVPKVSRGDQEDLITSGQIFAAYIRKMFWEVDPKKEEQKVLWIHRFESCQKYFPKLAQKDIQSFTDDVTLSDRAIDELNQEERLNIVRRVLKYVRKQKAQQEKQLHSDQDSESSSLTYAAVETHLEQSMKHIQSLEASWYLQWSQSENEKERQYTRRFDQSGSDLTKVYELAKDLFLELKSPEEVYEVYKSADNEVRSHRRIADAFRDALSCVLQDIKTSKDTTAVDRVADLIDVVNEHLQNGGTLLLQEDVLMVVRPLCADLEVDTGLKMELLQLLEKSFELSGDDIFLLIFYQTDAIVSSTWNKKITHEDIDSDEKRYQLFLTLIEESKNVDQISDIGKLLLIWPVLTASQLSANNPDQQPWVILLKKLIQYKDRRRFLELTKQCLKKVDLGLQCYMSLQDALLAEGFKVEVLKMALISTNETFVDRAYNIFTESKADDSSVDKELFGLITQTKTVKFVVRTSLYPSFVNYILEQSNNEIMFNDVVNQLKTAGLEAEAGALISRQSRLHPALSTIDIAFSSFKNWFQR